MVPSTHAGASLAPAPQADTRMGSGHVASPCGCFPVPLAFCLPSLCPLTQKPSSPLCPVQPLMATGDDRYQEGPLRSPHAGRNVRHGFQLEMPGPTSKSAERKTHRVFTRSRLSCSSSVTCSSSCDHFAPCKDRFLPDIQNSERRGTHGRSSVAAAGRGAKASIYGFLPASRSPHALCLRPAQSCSRGLAGGWSLKHIKKSRLSKLIYKLIAKSDQKPVKGFHETGIIKM